MVRWPAISRRGVSVRVDPSTLRVVIIPLFAVAARWDDDLRRFSRLSLAWGSGLSGWIRCRAGAEPALGGLNRVNSGSVLVYPSHPYGFGGEDGAVPWIR
jgi:hypothetical protein